MKGVFFKLMVSETFHPYRLGVISISSSGLSFYIDHGRQTGCLPECTWFAVLGSKTMLVVNGVWTCWANDLKEARTIDTWHLFALAPDTLAHPRLEATLGRELGQHHRKAIQQASVMGLDLQVFPP